ncbi:MAG: DUF2194 domain-containing protein [Ruminococcus sp.]
MKNKKFRFQRMQGIVLVFAMLAVALCLAQGNVTYNRQDRVMEPEVQEAAAQVSQPLESDPAECMILWEDDAAGTTGLEMMEEVLGQMKIPYNTCESREAAQTDWSAYRTVVLSVTHIELLGEELMEIFDWVEAGGGLMVLYPPEVNGVSQSISSKLGIRQLGNSYEEVDGLHFVREFMLGGQAKDYGITDPYESSLTVGLTEQCTVYLESTGEYPIPLIWEYSPGKGTVVVNNLGFLTKGYRGFYQASYSLLDEVCIYPVINASTFYIDDFPSPVPGGDSQYIQRDYGMGIADFYTNVWWNDIYNLGEKYGLRYTGLVIEEYSDKTEAPFEANEDTRRFRYFGNMLLDQGGEIGFHGYNHMPLCLTGFDYKGEYDSYNLWRSYDDMAASIHELERFCRELFPKEEFRVYVPPSNILSEEGRRMLREETDIQAIASVYLPDYENISYDQEFEVADDGIIETPRVISGYILDDYMQIVALSELNFHYVNTHFQHPDDTLDEDRGADLGWKEMYSRLSDYMEWLYTSAPDIRNLTGTELAAAVQIYDELQISREYTGEGIRLTLGSFSGEAWLMVRINEGTPGNVQGGKLQKLQEGLYLLQASENVINIELTGDAK